MTPLAHSLARLEQLLDSTIIALEQRDPVAEILRGGGHAAVSLWTRLRAPTHRRATSSVPSRERLREGR